MLANTWSVPLDHAKRGGHTASCERRPHHIDERHEEQVPVRKTVDNLFDKFYSLPLGGAYTGQGSTMMLNGIPWGIAVPGMGRSIYTGLTFKF